MITHAPLVAGNLPNVHICTHAHTILTIGAQGIPWDASAVGALNQCCSQRFACLTTILSLREHRCYNHRRTPMGTPHQILVAPHQILVAPHQILVTPHQILLTPHLVTKCRIMSIAGTLIRLLIRAHPEYLCPMTFV